MHGSILIQHNKTHTISLYRPQLQDEVLRLMKKKIVFICLFSNQRYVDKNIFKNNMLTLSGFIENKTLKFYGFLFNA